MTFEKKTICFFNSNKAWGGGEKWHFTTCKEFQRRGHKTILVTNLRSEIYKKAVKERLNAFPFQIHNLSFINPLKVLTLALFFKTQKVDAIIMNLPSDLKVAGLAAKLAGVKKIVYRRGMPHPLRNTWLNRLLFTKVLTHVVVNSQEIGRSLKAENEEWFPEKKVLLVYNGVDPDRAINKSRRTYVKGEGEFVIGNAGRLTEQKGQKYLIEMAEVLKRNGVKFKLLIAGGGELGNFLHQLIQSKGLDAEVKLLGHVDDMEGFFNSLDAFVFTSLYEGSANTLIETLQHGVPSIAFDVSSNPEIIQHEVTGFLARPFEVQELVRYVEEIRTNAQKRDQLAEGGLSLIKERFDNRKNLTLLQNIL